MDSQSKPELNFIRYTREFVFSLKDSPNVKQFSIPITFPTHFKGENIYNQSICTGHRLPRKKSQSTSSEGDKLIFAEAGGDSPADDLETGHHHQPSSSNYRGGGSWFRGGYRNHNSVSGCEQNNNENHGHSNAVLKPGFESHRRGAGDWTRGCGGWRQRSLSGNDQFNSSLFHHPARGGNKTGTNHHHWFSSGSSHDDCWSGSRGQMLSSSMRGAMGRGGGRGGGRAGSHRGGAMSSAPPPNSANVRTTSSKTSDIVPQFWHDEDWSDAAVDVPKTGSGDTAVKHQPAKQDERGLLVVTNKPQSTFAEAAAASASFDSSTLSARQLNVGITVSNNHSESTAHLDNRPHTGQSTNDGFPSNKPSSIASQRQLPLDDDPCVISAIPRHQSDDASTNQHNNTSRPLGIDHHHQQPPPVQWFYIDSSGQPRGPFVSHQMAQWFAAGHLSLGLKVKRHFDECFLPIETNLPISQSPSSQQPAPVASCQPGGDSGQQPADLAPRIDQLNLLDCQSEEPAVEDSPIIEQEEEDEPANDQEEDDNAPANDSRTLQAGPPQDACQGGEQSGKKSKKKKQRKAKKDKPLTLDQQRQMMCDVELQRRRDEARDRLLAEDARAKQEVEMIEQAEREAELERLATEQAASKQRVKQNQHEGGVKNALAQLKLPQTARWGSTPSDSSSSGGRIQSFAQIQADQASEAILEQHRLASMRQASTTADQDDHQPQPPTSKSRKNQTPATNWASLVGGGPGVGQVTHTAASHPTNTDPSTGTTATVVNTTNSSQSVARKQPTPSTTNQVAGPVSNSPPPPSQQRKQHFIVVNNSSTSVQQQSSIASTPSLWDLPPDLSSQPLSSAVAGGKNSKKKSKKKNQSQQSKPAVKSTASFEAKEELAHWCESQLSSVPLAGIDMPTLVDLLCELEAPDQVVEFIESSLGRSKRITSFSKAFLEKRACVLKIPVP